MASREAQPTDYRGRFKELQALELEARKDDLIEELLTRLDDLKGQRDEAKSDLETEREARRRLQRTLRDSQPNRERFAILILHLDADVFLFDDQWMADPPSGGEKIAAELVDKVSSYLKEVLDDTTNVQIVVKIYGDLFKLWKTYEAAGSGLGNMDLTRFFSHFNRKDALIDFVDFGPRKGSIERKLSGVISHYLLDDRTEHILLAAPHQAIPPILAPLDDTVFLDAIFQASSGTVGLTPFLAHLSSPLASPNSSNDHRSRLSLISAPPSSKDWDDLGYRITTHFETLFIIPPPPSTASSSQPQPPRSPLAKKVHHKERTAPPPVPPPPTGPNVGVNTGMPRLRIRKDGWRDERSPQRIHHGGNNHMMSGARGGGGYGQQVARRESYPNRFSGVPPAVPSIPGLHWP